MTFAFLEIFLLILIGIQAAPHRNRQSKQLSNEVKTEPLTCEPHITGLRCNFAELKQIKECQRTGTINVYKCRKIVISSDEKQTFTFFRFEENSQNASPFNPALIFIVNMWLLAGFSYWSLQIYRKHLKSRRTEEIINKHQ